MATDNQSELPQSQLDKFNEAARENGADENAKRWDERLGKLVKVKPAPGKTG